MGHYLLEAEGSNSGHPNPLLILQVQKEARNNIN